MPIASWLSICPAQGHADNDCAAVAIAASDMLKPGNSKARPRNLGGETRVRLKAAILLLGFLVPMATAEGEGLLDRSANRPPDIVQQDNGGNLLERIEFVEAHKNDPIYRVPLECFSSCTLLLGIAGACISKGSLLFFHSAEIDGKMAPKYLNDYAASYYPPAIQKWVKDHHALDREGWTLMDWQTAASLGVKVCQ
jgi:hypothetical protein